MHSESFLSVPATEEMYARYIANPLGIGAKSYPVYRVLEDGTMVVPRDKNIAPPRNIQRRKMTSSILLRDYQEEPVATCVYNLIVETPGLLLKAACGTGKTLMALAVADILDITSVIILVDQMGIADQWRARIEQFLPGETIEVFHSKASDIETLRESTAKFRIVVAQSLMRQDWLTDPVKCDLLICDEAHVFSAPCFCNAIYNINYLRSIALTATEDRKDGLTWVFLAFLGTKVVEVKGRTMTAKVVRPTTTVGVNWHAYATAWCVVNKKMTWKAACAKCPLYNKFPVRCGGNLPLTDRGVKWNTDRLMWTSLLVDICNKESYLDWFVPIIAKFHEKGRQVLIFNQFRAPLAYLHEKVSELVGEDKVGMYVSATKNADEELAKPLTFTTYKMSQKALDVPWKDAAIFTSPVSDIRQVVGRSTRTVVGKKQPIIFDPVIEDVIILKRQAEKRLKQYKELGFEL